MTPESEFLFTPENLIENIDKLGAWSSYGLAEQAIEHYHPECLGMEGMEKLNYISNLKCNGEENTHWQDWIIKYQKEVGYNAPNGFNPKCVNKY